VINRLDCATNASLQVPTVRQRMDSIGVEVVNKSPQEFEAVLKHDAQRYGKLIKELGITNE